MGRKKRSSTYDESWALYNVDAVGFKNGKHSGNSRSVTADSSDDNPDAGDCKLNRSA